MADLDRQIRQLLVPILDSLGLVLWDMEFRKQGPTWLLRLFIDRTDTGVTLDDCEKVSRDLGTVLDVEDVIPHSYTLEVSSPGLDRTLSTPEHFARFLGSRIRVKTYGLINGQKVFRGTLLEANSESIKMTVTTGETLVILLNNIAKSSLEIIA